MDEPALKLVLTDDFSATVMAREIQQGTQVRDLTADTIVPYPSRAQDCGCRLPYSVLIGMRNRAPRMVPTHQCTKTPGISFNPTDWVQTSPVYVTDHGVSLCTPVHVTEFRLPVNDCGRQWLLSARQGSAPPNYLNKILSDRGWDWRGNVLVVHECGLRNCGILEWVSSNLDQLRQLLARQA
jgi:hypothetical protein